MTINLDGFLVRDQWQQAHPIGNHVVSVQGLGTDEFDHGRFLHHMCNYTEGRDLMSYSRRTSSETALAVMLCGGLLLSACKESTRISGMATDQAEQALDGHSSAESFVPRVDSNSHDSMLIRSEIANNNADGIYALDEETCMGHGGYISVDDSGADVCSFGAVLAAFECARPDGPERVSVIARSERGILFERSSDAYETLVYSPSGSGEKFVGEYTTFWIKGNQATLMTENEQYVCNAVDN